MTINHFFVNAPEFFFRHGLEYMFVGDEIPNHNSPGSAEIYYCSPYLSGLPKSVVGCVIFKSDDKRRRGTDKCNWKPGDNEPFPVESFIQIVGIIAHRTI